MTAAAGVADGVASIVEGEGAVVTGDGAEAWAVGDRMPAAVARPGTVEELSGLLARASREGWALAPAGAGSWLGGGGPPERLDLVVSTSRIDGIHEYEPGDLTLTAGAGMGMGALRAETRANGQWLPQDPAGAAGGTLGALLATGLPGPLVAGFGRPRNHALGVTLVTGDGRVLRPGGRVVKNVAGYDLVRLAVGSWGTLGIVAGASVRLFPLAETDLTLVFEPGGREEEVDLARRLATASVVPAALELVRPLAGGKSGRHGGGEGPGAVVARLLGRAEEAAATARILEERAGRSADGRREGPESVELHRALESADPDATLELRLSLLPARLGELLDVADRLSGSLEPAAARERERAVHLTTGTLRAAYVGEPSDEVEVGAWCDAIGRARSRLEAAGGSLIVARGPAAVVRRVGAFGGPGDAGDLVRKLKRAFDPAGILLPGRLVA